jgi:hypothetical protein
MKIIAAIEEPTVIRKILEHLGLPNVDQLRNLAKSVTVE